MVETKVLLVNRYNLKLQFEIILSMERISRYLQHCSFQQFAILGLASHMAKAT